MSTSVTRWRQWSNAASSPITDKTASGWPRSSPGWSLEPLDLADDVVAEIADESAVKRRKTFYRRGPEPLQQRLDTRKDPVVEPEGIGKRALCHLHMTAPRDQSRRR